jgi:hypothetical protein
VRERERERKRRRRGERTKEGEGGRERERADPIDGEYAYSFLSYDSVTKFNILHSCFLPRISFAIFW